MDLLSIFLDVIGYNKAKSDGERRLFKMWLIGDIVLFLIFAIILIIVLAR